MAMISRVVSFIRQGDPGVGISSELDYFKATAAKTAPAWANNGTWTLDGTPSNFSAANPYLWKVHITNYTDGGQDISSATLVGYWGQDGAPGTPGDKGGRGLYMPSSKLWDEYPTGYQFQAGGETDERLDIVLFRSGTNVFAYACKKTHTKSTLYKPGNTTYWESGQQWTFIATAVLLAERARIDNLFVNDLEIVSSTGELLAQMNKDRIFIRGDIQAGASNGKHVKLNPDNQTVEIYDSNGALCTTLDGKVYSALTDVLPSASAATISGVQASVTINSASAASAEDYCCSATTLNGGTLSVTVGQFQLSGSVVSSGSAGGITMTSQASAFLTLKRAGVVIQRKTLVSIGSDSSLYRTHYSSTYKFAIPSGSGSYQLFLEIQGTNINASCSISAPTITHAVDSFLSTFFANGFALTQSTTNYLVAMAISKVMRMYLGSTDGSGFYINQIRQPYTIFAGKITNAASPAVTALLGSASCSRATDKKNGYTVSVTVPAGLTASRIFCQATGFGNVDGGADSYSFASIKSQSLSGTTLTVVVIVSNDDTPDWGSFNLEVKYF